MGEENFKIILVFLYLFSMFALFSNRFIYYYTSFLSCIDESVTNDLFSFDNIKVCLEFFSTISKPTFGYHVNRRTFCFQSNHTSYPDAHFSNQLR